MKIVSFSTVVNQEVLHVQLPFNKALFLNEHDDLQGYKIIYFINQTYIMLLLILKDDAILVITQYTE